MFGYIIDDTTWFKMNIQYGGRTFENFNPVYVGTINKGVVSFSIADWAKPYTSNLDDFCRL